MHGKILFLSKVAAALLVLGLAAALFNFVTSKLGEGWGLFWAILAAANLALGITLFYWVLVDWLNLRLAKKSPPSDLGRADQSVICLSGKVKVSGDTLLTPFTRTECAAYTYNISSTTEKTSDTGTRSVDIASGFHMRPTQLETEFGSITIRALPEVESALRESSHDKWRDECREYLENLIGTAPNDFQINREAAKLAAQVEHQGEVHEDYCLVKSINNLHRYTLVEEYVPCDTSITVIGTYDNVLGALNGRKSRIGPNLIVYRGSRAEMIDRISKEVSSYIKAVFIMLGIAGAITVYAGSI